MKYKYDYQNLKGEIIKKYGSLTNFASKGLNISKISFSNILNSKTQFSQEKIVKTCELLDINPKDIGYYFFNKKVAKSCNNDDDTTR